MVTSNGGARHAVVGDDEETEAVAGRPDRTADAQANDHLRAEAVEPEAIGHERLAVEREADLTLGEA